MIGKMLAALAASFVLIGCSGAENEPSETKPTPTKSEVADRAAGDDTAPASDQDAENLEITAETTATQAVEAIDPVELGRRAFTQCAICHKTKEGERSVVGPNLYGIVGRTAGSEDFNYSDAVRDSGIVWTEENLNAFIENPRDLIPGNRMAYAGERNADRRVAIIAYMKSLTAE